MEGEGRAGCLAVHRATTGISVSNPVKRRYVAQLEDLQPTVKVIVTETNQDESEPNADKPRKPRKSDLSKCVKEGEERPVGLVQGTNTQQVIYLGETVGLDLSVKGSEGAQVSEVEASPSLGRWSEEEGGSADPVYYVQCPECNKKLKQKSYRSHVRTHTGVKQFKCDLCDDRFTRKNDVMRHKRLIHEKPRDFQCEQCQKYFVSQENLVLHVEKHKTEMKCKVCDHSFGKKEYYDNHIRYVHPNGGHVTEQHNPHDIEESNELNGDGTADRQGFLEVKKSEPAPVILRKADPRKFEDLAQNDLKIIYLGAPDADEPANPGAPVPAPVTKQEVPPPPPPIIVDSYGKAAKTDDTIQIVDDSGNVGQILKISDGTFMILDCKDTPPAKAAATEESPVGSSNYTTATTDTTILQDAVQTLIDAVQELIQTHESWEEEGPAPDKVVEAPPEEAAVSATEGAVEQVEGLSEEVWSRLRSEYPGAEFVVVTDQ